MNKVKGHTQLPLIAKNIDSLFNGRHNQLHMAA
jgi:hypothetical protein